MARSRRSLEVRPTRRLGLVANNLFGLPIFHTADWIFNAYVVETDDGLVVVDPGLTTVAEQIVAVVTGQMERDMADVKSVICTHGHSDHVSGVSTLLGQCSAQAHLPARCEAYLDGEVPRNFPLVESSVRFMAMYSQQPFSFSALKAFAAGSKIGFGRTDQMRLDFEPTGFLDDGAAVPFASGWEVLHAPGHTDDSTCFYHADSATLISGDTVVTEDGTPWFNPEFIDLDVSNETTERLLSLRVRHLLPGHGLPIEAPNVWARAKRPLDRPTSRSFLASCARRFGRWG